jgi:polygalacturonase
MVLPAPTRLFAIVLAWIAVGAAALGAEPDTLALGLRVSPQSLRSDEVTLLWDRTDSAGQATAYVVLRDGQPVGETTHGHLTVTGLAPDQDYGLALKEVATGRTTATLKLRTKQAETVVSILDHGAVGDGKTLNTKAIQAAIAACPPGGIVRVPAGTFVSGALFLKSDMTFEVAAGGTLKGSKDAKDYLPFILNRFEGWEMETYASLLNAGSLDRGGATKVQRLAIRGRGRISGGGATLAKAMTEAHGVRSRGRLICLLNDADVEIAGLTLDNSPCWGVHYIYSRNIVCRDLDIHSNVRNGDGIDPDSSRDAWIFGCAFDTGDDCIAVKSGKNPEGNRVNLPTERLRIFDCRFTRGHGLSIGSEMSGGVRDVLVEDCVAGKLLNGFQIKATRERGGFVENVVVRDCELQKISILTKLSYNNDGEAAPAPPVFRNFRFRRIDLSKATDGKPAIIIQGYAEEGHRTRQLTFDDLSLPAQAVIEVDQAEDVTFTNLRTADGAQPTFKETRSVRVTR